jgi:outer membrane protein assembly factor BamE (lipoprotein component of BamABCDE complex)
VGPARNNIDRHGLVVALVAAVVTGVSGCKTESMNAYVYEGGHPKQKYEFKEVKSRVKGLRPGMLKSEVFIHLGSPAEDHGTIWVYLPDETGYILPTELLEVRFERNRYVSHEFRSVVFGQRPAPK